MKKQVAIVILLLLGLLNTSVYAYQLKVESWPEGSGSVSGGGTYEEGTQVSLNTYPNTGFRFLGWFDGNEKVSQNRSFKYNMPMRDVTLTAKYEFHPDSPADPSMPDTTARFSFKAKVWPEGSGTVNISEGKYPYGSKLSLSTSANSGFAFLGWYDGEEELSSSKNYSYTMPSRNVELTAKYEFRPGSPGDPIAVAEKYPLTILRDPEGGGSVSPASGSRYAEGDKISLSASLNSGYVFDGWVDAFGSVISTSRNHTIIMPAAPTELTAKFRFSPSSPDDPQPSVPTRNIIYGSRVSAYPGGMAFFDISLENPDAIVGIDLNILLPEGLGFDMEKATPSDRGAMHTLSLEPLGSEGAWHLSLKGEESFQGGNGALVRIPLSVPADVETGTVYSVILSDAMVYRDNGASEGVAVRDGQIKITAKPDDLPDSPDFRVTSVSSESVEIMPEDAVTVNWTVTNEGTLDAIGGWSESIYLADEAGKRVMLGTVFHDVAGLKVGEKVSRSATLTVPRLPGLSGRLNPAVTLMPYLASDELIQLQANNSATGEGFPISLGKRLILTLPEIITEGKDVSVRGQLARSGSWDESESFALSSVDGDERVKLPENVIIPRDQSAAWFQIKVESNKVADPSASMTVKAAGNGYEAVEANITLMDSQLPAIAIETDSEEVTEGGKATLALTIPYAFNEDISISLSAAPADRVSIPSSVVVPAGQTEVSVGLEVADNDAVDGHHEVAILASAAGFETGSTYLFIIDNDMPELQMKLSPMEINENAGPLAVRGEISRSSNLDKRVTLLLTADNANQVNFPVDKIVLERGVSSAEFTVGVIDNDKVEGDRDVEISASVFVSSCNCTAVGGHAGSVSGTLHILDNDRPSLGLVSLKSVIAEGDNSGVTVTLSRNAELNKALTVALSCDTPGALQMPESIVIKKGAESVNFKVTAPVNNVADDDRTVVVSAQADGYAASNLWMMITDRTLPDARISRISVSEKEVVAGGEVDVTLMLTSAGVTPLPAQTCVAIYADGNIVGRIWLQEPLAPGVTKELVKKVALPSRAGSCDIYAVANPDKIFKEINYSDNQSSQVRITLTSPFKAGVEVSSAKISKGESVLVKGRLDSQSPEGQEVEVYMINDGLRVAENTVAAADGTFEVTFTPYMAQTGHFSVGACCPGEMLSEEMASFEIIDLKRTDNGYVTCEGVAGVSSRISVGIKNPCGLSLTNLEAHALNVPEGIKVDVNSPASLKAGEKGMIVLDVTSMRATEGRDWERFSIVVASEEGAELEVPVYWYSRNPKGKLAGSVTSIDLELPQDAAIEYPVTIQNNGAGETGKIEIVLPAWMKSAGPTRLPSLSPGEESTITLLLKPTSDMPLNHTVSGQLGINCENGDGISISYKVMPVSNQPAKLLVQACDEYTYNTVEAPKVKGAKVSVVNPGTGFTVADGLTGEDGTYLVELPAGYYRVSVSADKHDAWSNIVFLNPGKTNTVTANISFNPITISYNVVPTEVEDEYLIETDVRFEVNVPAPVVRIIAPKRIDGDSMEVGDATIINVQMVNEGLMTAFNTTPLFEKDNPEWKFEPLDHTEPFDLAPHQSVNIPVRITRIADVMSKMPPAGMRHNAAEDMYGSYNACMSHLAGLYEVICGEKLSKNIPAENLAMKMCASAATLTGIYSAISNLLDDAILYGPLGRGKDYGSSTELQYVGGEQKFSLCDTCDAAKAEKVIDTLIGTVGGPVGQFWDILSKAVKTYREEGRIIKVVIKDAADNIVPNVLDYLLSGAGSIFNLTAMIIEVSEPCEKNTTSGEPSSKKLRKAIEEDEDSYFDDDDPLFAHSWQETFYNESKEFCEGWEALKDFFETILGDAVWIFDPSEDKLEFMRYVASLEEGSVVSDEEVALRKPESVSFEQARTYLDRIVGVVEVSELYGDDIIKSLDTFASVEDAAVEAGYESGADRFFKAYAAYENEFDKLKNHAVCASVGLRFSQTMTMTREAFRGTLEVFNGHENIPMREVKLNLTVTDPDGNMATSREFQINPESLTGFKGDLDIMAGWELNAGENGVAEIIFIPTRYAAPDGPLVWDFGGSLTYIDPFTDLEVTRKLQPVSVTVNPTPVLDLTYFLQRDVYSDDPLTPDVVEQSEGAEFALVINNSGVGEAKNVKIVTRQPQIVDNEKGILLETAFTSSQLNGGERHLSLGENIATDFGNIPARTAAYAQWWFESSLAGHFTEYEVNATHVSSYDNPDLSLLGNVEIHELIRGITDPTITENSPRRVFLANDIADADDYPDMVYYSDASMQESLGKAILSSEMLDRFTYRINVQPMLQGWVYGCMEDPTGGRLKLVSVVRLSDGKELPVDNCWQTSMTMRDGNKPVHEYLLHIAVNTDKAESYRLLFESRPSGILEVKEINGVPSDSDGPIDPVQNLTVNFSKDVDQDSFTPDALRLTRAGERLDVSDISIELVSPAEYRVGFGDITVCEGYYVFTVDASKILDIEGFEGKDGKSVAWFQNGKSINEVSSPFDNNQKFSIWPIPVRENMSMSGNFNQIVRLEIYDTAGTLLGRWSDLSPNSGGHRDGYVNSVQIKVKDIPSGIRIVRAVTDSGIIYSRRVLFITD